MKTLWYFFAQTKHTKLKTVKFEIFLLFIYFIFVNNWERNWSLDLSLMLLDKVCEVDLWDWSLQVFEKHQVDIPKKINNTPHCMAGHSRILPRHTWTEESKTFNWKMYFVTAFDCFFFWVQIFLGGRGLDFKSKV